MPDDIRTHAKSLLKQYEKRSKATKIIDSARILAQLALQNKGLYPAHRRAMLNCAVWYCTEADGKWKTRYKSKKVWDLAKDEPDSLVLINHEHVFTRKNLVDEMLRNDEKLLDELPELHRLLDTAIGCIVTECEHRELTDGYGWHRYAEKVVVYDTAIVPPEIVELHLAQVLCAIDK